VSFCSAAARPRVPRVTPRVACSPGGTNGELQTQGWLQSDTGQPDSAKPTVSTP